MDNKINFSIPDEVVVDVISKIADAINQLKPYLIALTPTERHDLPKMSDGSLPFVQKCLDYCQLHPEFAPTYVNFGSLVKDMEIYQQIVPIYRLVLPLENKLNDTAMEAGAESYITSLSYYNSVKLAAKADIPGAKAIYEDLKKRFVKEKATVPTPQNN